MKNYFIIILVFSVTLFLNSCGKKFLTENPYSSVAAADAILSASDMAAAVNGVYAGMRSANLYGRTLPIMGDLMADNIYISASNSGRYLSQWQYSITVSDPFVDGTWADAYTVILRANNVINAEIDSSSPQVTELKGEAYAVRALMYFELIRQFAKPYTVDSTSDGVPLVLTYDPNAKPARAKVNAVYAQILSDLYHSISMINEDDKSTAYINKYGAEAILARVCQFMNNWQSAETYALDIATNGGYTLTTSDQLQTYWAGFTPRTDRVETIFEIEYDRVDYLGTDALDAFYSQDGYGDALCTNGLYQSYTATDARQSLIVAGTRAGDSVWIVNKYPNTSNPDGTDNTKVIRYAEVLLILAEAYHFNGDDADALIWLNTVAQQRDPSFAGYMDTGDSLETDILNERRKELAFEGFRLWDFIRLNLDITRENNTQEYPGQIPILIPAADTRRQMPIPEVETDANSNISQNPGY
jgi:starch-binding outer membrane protein, SusD/RagB family